MKDHPAIRFYTAFQDGNAQGMTNEYSSQVQFQDPAFGKLSGQDAMDMWTMLLSRGSKSEVTFDEVTLTDTFAKVKWVARYNFGEKKRPVVNEVTATMKIEDGKIVEHTDEFDFKVWAKQALGNPISFFSGTQFFQNYFQGKCTGMLKTYQSKQENNAIEC